MIDHEDFDTLRSVLGEEDAIRERIIKRSRDVLKASKHAIYSLHAGEDAKDLLVDAEKGLAELLPLASARPHLRSGALAAAVEEFVEARLLGRFFSDGTLLPAAKIPQAQPEEYLAGLCDFTGELGRHAVHRATARDIPAVERIQRIMDLIMGELVRFEFRNSELRRKYDSVKYNLKKVEQLRYELA